MKKIEQYAQLSGSKCQKTPWCLLQSKHALDHTVRLYNLSESLRIASSTTFSFFQIFPAWLFHLSLFLFPVLPVLLCFLSPSATQASSLFLPPSECCLPPGFIVKFKCFLIITLTLQVLYPSEFQVTKRIHNKQGFRTRVWGLQKYWIMITFLTQYIEVYHRPYP